MICYVFTLIIKNLIYILIYTLLLYLTWLIVWNFRLEIYHPNKKWQYNNNYYAFIKIIFLPMKVFLYILYIFSYLNRPLRQFICFCNRFILQYMIEFNTFFITLLISFLILSWKYVPVCKVSTHFLFKDEFLYILLI